MPRRPSSTPSASARYWQRRVSSPAFKRELTALIAQDLRALAAVTFGEVVDVQMMRELIGRWDEILAVDAIAAVAVGLRKEARQRARRTKRSLGAILGDQFTADVEAALDDATNLSRYAEDFIDRMMQRELVQSLMTDLVYTAIVSFNRRMNPLFGNLALMAVDSQIKSFIRMFMPMLQRQATTFLIDRKNHALFADFARAAARQVLNEPLPQLLELFSRGTDAEAEALIGRTVRSPQLRGLVRDVALLVSNAVLRDLGGKRIGTVLALDDNADWLAKRLMAPLLAALSRPHIAAFVSRELDRASGPPAPSKVARKGRR